MDNPALTSVLSRQHQVWRRLKVIYACAVASGLIWVSAQSWEVIEGWLSWKHFPIAIGALASWFALVLLLGSGWRGAFSAWTGIRLRTGDWISMQMAAWTGRYLPGKVGLLAGKMSAVSLGATWKQIAGSVLSEQIAFVVSGASLAMLTSDHLCAAIPRIVCANSGLFEAVAIVLIMATLMCSWLYGRRFMPHAEPTWFFKLLAWSSLAHFAGGFGFYLVLNSMLPEPPTLLESVSLLAVAHVAGVLAIFAPAGLGVREAVIAAALAPQVGWAQALAISALQRAIVVIADGFVAFAALVLSRRGN